MESIKTIMETPTPFSGSDYTFNLVAQQIEEKFGAQARKDFDPQHNCRTYASWAQLGYRVKKGEKALQSVTYLEQKDATGKVVKRFPRKISLFFFPQVELIRHK